VAAAVVFTAIHLAPAGVVVPLQVSRWVSLAVHD
jgi:hypothetical protein